MNSLQRYLPFGMNIELTTSCPLRCPQCYCTLEGGKHISYETAAKFIRQAKEIGIKHIELSGGETLCYPELFDLIKLAHEIGLETNIAISGWNFNEACLDRLTQSGVSNIFVSLNGPTEEINKLTRDGYQHAISALQLLQSKGFSNVYINWVMHQSNADSLQEMIKLAQNYSVRAIVVLAPKPTSKHELNTIPTHQQMQNVAQIIKAAPPGTIRIEACFSPLLAMVRDTKLFGNLNVGRTKGCGAGKNLLSISVDGKLSPCRHLDYYEEYDSIEEYWFNSPVIAKLNQVAEESPASPCNKCRFEKYCRPCIAISSKLENALYRGNKYCTAFQDAEQSSK